jgi:hypothetical protein
MENVFDAKDAQNYIDRINNLTPKPKVCGENVCRSDVGAL